VKPERTPLPFVIAALVRDGAPVTPLPSPWTRLGLWTVKAVSAAAVVTLLFGVRADIGAHLHDVRFIVLALVTIALAVSAAAGAFVLSVPGADRWRAARWLPPIAATAWAALLWTRLDAMGQPIARLVATRPHPACVLLILSISALPGFWLFHMLRRAAPIDKPWTGALAALASLTVGALGTQFICPIDNPAHQLLWHVAPVAVLTSVGLWLGARLFDWRRRAGTFPPLP
jgi:hypothetical protein